MSYTPDFMKQIVKIGFQLFETNEKLDMKFLQNKLDSPDTQELFIEVFQYLNLHIIPLLQHVSLLNICVKKVYEAIAYKNHPQELLDTANLFLETLVQTVINRLTTNLDKQADYGFLAIKILVQYNKSDWISVMSQYPHLIDNRVLEKLADSDMWTELEFLSQYWPQFSKQCDFEYICILQKNLSRFIQLFPQIINVIKFRNISPEYYSMLKDNGKDIDYELYHTGVKYSVLCNLLTEGQYEGIKTLIELGANPYIVHNGVSFIEEFKRINAPRFAVYDLIK